MRILYSILWWFALPFVLLRIYRRGKLEPGYRQHVPERLGFYPDTPPAKRRLWVHAVSVGETRAAEPLVRALMAEFPDGQILLTCMTPTGRETGAQLFAEEIRNGKLIQSFLPYDTGIMMSRFINHFQPSLCVLMETEIWPNLIHQCVRHQVPLTLVNARLSEKSLRKGKKFKSIMEEAARGFSAVAAQTQTDADRLNEFGANRIAVTGSVKFDVQPPEEKLQLGRHLREAIGSRPVFMCASTRLGEEPQLLDALSTLREDALLLLVPRHPQRFDEVANMITSRNIKMVRRSSLSADFNDQIPADTRILLGDSMGEMFMYYATCDATFIGGSLEKLGGQNLIEPCAVEKPVLIGPHTFNFEAITEDAIKIGAAIRIQSAKELFEQANGLLADHEKLVQMGQIARRFAEKQHGATERTVRLLAPLVK